MIKSDIQGATILEVGSLNINGSLRSYVESHKPVRYVGADIEHAMAVEIYSQLESGLMTNAANLTDDEHLISICNWLINL